jgi:hypothetical protein
MVDVPHLYTPAGPIHGRSLAARLGIVFALLASVVACSGADDGSADGDGTNDEDGVVAASTEDALTSAGPCAGRPIARAVRCAQAKGARVLSFYRSPAEQERVRRENHCTNRCTGMAGCVRPTADCSSSPHTRCEAVDFVNDGAPVSRSALRTCGLAKTTLPHANHYDLVN